MDVVRIDRAGNPFLVATRCQDCGHIVFPAQSFCSRCLGFRVTEIPVGRKGILKARSTAHFAPASFDPGYPFGYVDIEEGYRVFAHLEGDAEKLKIGAAVELTAKTVSLGQAGSRLIPCYRPA